MLTGKLEIEYYQLTPMGTQRLQSGTIPKNISRTLVGILQKFVKLGGTAEVDELSHSTGLGPSFVRRGLKSLIDLGYVTPVVLESSK